MASLFNDFAAPFLDDAAKFVFGESVTFTCAGHAAVTIAAPFIRAAASVQIQGEVAVEVTRPQLQVWLADLPATPVKGDVAVIGTETYKVTEMEEDGCGTATLTLALQL